MRLTHGTIRTPCDLHRRGEATTALSPPDWLQFVRQDPGPEKRNSGSFAPGGSECRSLAFGGWGGDYFKPAKVVLIAAKFGRSFGVGVCSAYCTTPFRSITNAARAEVAPKPSRSSSSTP